MELFVGKAKDMTFKALLYNFIKNTRPIERLEPVDFSVN